MTKKLAAQTVIVLGRSQTPTIIITNDYNQVLTQYWLLRMFLSIKKFIKRIIDKETKTPNSSLILWSIKYKGQKCF